MAMYPIEKTIVINACRKFLEDNKDLDDCYIDNEIIQRVYDTLKTRAYTYLNNVILDEHELDCLTKYLEDV